MKVVMQFHSCNPTLWRHYRWESSDLHRKTHSRDHMMISTTNTTAVMMTARWGMLNRRACSLLSPLGFRLVFLYFLQIFCSVWSTVATSTDTSAICSRGGRTHSHSNAKCTPLVAVNCTRVSYRSTLSRTDCRRTHNVLIDPECMWEKRGQEFKWYKVHRENIHVHKVKGQHSHLAVEQWRKLVSTSNDAPLLVTLALEERKADSTSNSIRCSSALSLSYPTDMYYSFGVIPYCATGT